MFQAEAFIKTVKFAAVALLVIAIVSGLWYVSNLKANLAISEMNNTKLKDSIKTQKKTTEKLRNDIAQIRILNAELDALNYKQEKEIKKLNNKFNIKASGQSRDFGAISRARPGLINKIINTATKNVNRCFELATGAPLKAAETNPECESLTGVEK